MKDLERLLMIGIGVYGVIRVGEQFVGKLEQIDRKGLNVFDGVAAVGLGIILINRINSTADLLS